MSKKYNTDQVAIVNGFPSDWLRKWPITKQVRKN